MKFTSLSTPEKVLALQIFNELLQNEQQKALQAINAFKEDKPFGGTSISGLVTRPTFGKPIQDLSYQGLATEIARRYVDESGKLGPGLEKAFCAEEVRLFDKHGVYFGVHVSPKLLAVCEGLVVDHEDLVLDGFPDAYAIPKCEPAVIEAYFSTLREQKGIDADVSSLVLADTTTPPGFDGKRILNPRGLNEKLSYLSDLTTQAVRDLGMECDPLYFFSTDSDSPHRVALSERQMPIEGYPLTPGLTMCGSTAAIDGFDFKYIYRMGLISQGICSNIIASRFSCEYTPFVLFGMLSPYGYSNGAIPTGKMGQVRYKGDMDVKTEFEFQFENCIARLM